MVVPSSDLAQNNARLPDKSLHEMLQVALDWIVALSPGESAHNRLVRRCLLWQQTLSVRFCGRTLSARLFMDSTECKRGGISPRSRINPTLACTGALVSVYCTKEADHDLQSAGYGKCEEAGVVKRGEVRRIATALKVVEEVQEEVQEVKDEWEDEEVEGNGGLKVEEIRSSCDDHEMTHTSQP